MTPLLSACSQYWSRTCENYKPGELCKVLSLLFNSGANPNAETFGTRAIHKICSTWFFDMNPLYLLIERGAILDSRDTMGETPLHKACYHRNVAAIRVLLEHGANVHHTNTRSQTPISKLFAETFGAVSGNHAANAAELLFSYGAQMSEGSRVMLPVNLEERPNSVEQVLRHYNVPYEVHEHPWYQ